ncbi:hypothetical protein LEP1GSC127_4064 [Leptospira kirschneri str. 200801925]|nr:hypothetical protein LEP1GSC018_1004 [Leptospira kirschneri str. 2008720114]EKQ82069.1 hypothetical protein LEP1GSC064_3962 [Leptospira kirschneri serovar Grippotyphosa str. Moskva]EKR10221.1 hypothetical protein LEP1GSC122_4139 [Leptospira kirschneri serovar Valbuzzi str. 200702274]EMK03712.1 hypothetical protein LEP1GSC166_3210 [Leptospira kirschneri]EMK04570.1 hypothetical protein LEP1GSC176_0526 [Leptospira kirschneri str. MMD1493]EMK18206.1 hypothetical protein LEP1GSC042_1905 [Leptosp
MPNLFQNLECGTSFKKQQIRVKRNLLKTSISLVKSIVNF